MQKLFLNKEVLNTVDNKTEKDLQKFICANWKTLFSGYTFIKDEFPLKGDVHGLGKKGRIDILAYNPITKRFVIFELKQDYNDSVMVQATNYSCYVERSFQDTYLSATQEYEAALPKASEVKKDGVEVVLIARTFSGGQIHQAKKLKESVTLIEYRWFSNDILFFDYINSTPVTSFVVSESTPESIAKRWQDIVDGIASRSQYIEIRKFGEKLQKYSLPTRKNVEDIRRLIEKAPKSITNRNFNSKLAALRKLLDEFGLTKK